MPSRSAISISVSLAGAVSSRPSMVKVTMGTSTGSRWGRGMAFMAVLSSHFVRKEFDHTVDRVWRRLPQSANRGIAHHLGEIRERLTIPLVALDQHIGLGRAHTAGRALAAGLMLEEAHHVAGRRLGSILIRQHDHSGGADEAAMRLQGVEIERYVAHRGRQDAARCAAG